VAGVFHICLSIVHYSLKTRMSVATLIVLMGATGVGKTEVSIALAQHFGTEIVSCDSRQIYREMRIGTAVPTPAQLRAVPHHFIMSHSIHQPYTAGKYEIEALALLEKLFATHHTVLMVGGSGLYIDAICQGIDDFPDTDPVLRQELMARHAHEGLDNLRKELKLIDEVSYHTLDMQNPRRILRALEVSLATGKPYSSLKQGKKQRPFRIIKIGLQRPREALYARINVRVQQMIAEGWLDEARSLYPFRHLPALNTVGYKEWFTHLDGKAGFEETVSLIQQHTRNYAKKQGSYWARYHDIQWVDAAEPEKILSLLSS
jgi:tRNA dimethylallyltransferase